MLPKLPTSPPPSSASVRLSMQGNKSKGTAAETKLGSILKAKGVLNYSVNDSRLPGSPDFAFWDNQVAILVNGCYWHRCPHCKPNFPKSNQQYWAAKFERNRLRDKRTKAMLRSIGWQPIIIWECKLKKDPEKVVRRIQRVLKAGRG